MKLKELLLFWTPMGFAISNIIKTNGITPISGEIKINHPYNENTITPRGLWNTCYDGVYLIYSPEYPKRKIINEINSVTKQLNDLQKQLEALTKND